MNLGELEEKVKELELSERLRKIEQAQKRREVSRRTIAAQRRNAKGRIGRKKA
jgi:hypothetical protein